MGLDRWWSNSSAGVGAKCPRVLAGARVYTRVSAHEKRRFDSNCTVFKEEEEEEEEEETAARS